MNSNQRTMKTHLKSLFPDKTLSLYRMKLKLLFFISICLLFTNCKNKTKDLVPVETESKAFNYENDSCKIHIKEVNINNISHYTNSYTIDPFLTMHSDCISLVDLLCILKDIDKTSITLDSKDLENKHYSVIVDQQEKNARQDSMIKSKIMEALPIKIEKNSYTIDTIMISVSDRKKFVKHTNTTISDTIRSKAKISQDSMVFENYTLKDIIALISKEYDKALVLPSKETRRINLKLKKTDWNILEENLKSDLGLALNTVTYQKMNYIVKKK